MIASKFSTKELMAVCCAREIKNSEVVFVGIGLPMMGALVAYNTHAKDSVFVYEGGGVGGMSRRVPWSIGDNPTVENALTILEMWRLFGDAQAGFIGRGIIGGAQIDKYGNLNTTVIMGEQNSYAHPKIRLPGSGGANDIASACGETVIVMQLEPGKFIEKIDYITSPGHLSGPGSRKAAGLVGNGPVAVITQKGIFRFDHDTKEMYLDSLFPNVTVEEIKALVGWELQVVDNIQIVEPPQQEEISIIQGLDPKGIMLGTKPNPDETFEEFYELMRQAYSAVQLNL